MTRMGAKKNRRGKLQLETQLADSVVSSQVEGCDGELRFVWQPEALSKACALGDDVRANGRLDRKPNDTDFAKHQVNYSATKYIKP
mmetsp:Transcript_9323/g.15470  ORF Transcript_9323/g.15470 Transcript_9323/m.15470 type:complete len:86 (+) Transcript_9323:73-330(+)